MSESVNKIETQLPTSEQDIPPSLEITAPAKNKLTKETVDLLERERFEHKKSIDRWGFILLGSCSLFRDVSH